ncbi:MAG: hypothetical protein J5929_01910 [Eubacterium sp.]|nr:hypothetical protein [Eubacterium sp.]
MTYEVTIKVDARYRVTVEAQNIEKAKRIAESKYMEADLGEIDDVVDSNIIIVQDKEGNYLYER